MGPRVNSLPCRSGAPSHFRAALRSAGPRRSGRSCFHHRRRRRPNLGTGLWRAKPRACFAAAAATTTIEAASSSAAAAADPRRRAGSHSNSIPSCRCRCRRCRARRLCRSSSCCSPHCCRQQTECHRTRCLAAFRARRGPSRFPTGSAAPTRSTDRRTHRRWRRPRHRRHRRRCIPVTCRCSLRRRRRHHHRLRAPCSSTQRGTRGYPRRHRHRRRTMSRARRRRRPRRRHSSRHGRSRACRRD